MLIETFVETPRYTGVACKESGWIRVSMNQWLGLNDKLKALAAPASESCKLRRQYIE